jgi:tRNA (guanine37-N1)-methyltransferase
MLKITILTLFPEMFVGPLSLSIIQRAQKKELVEINYTNIRDFGEGRHKMVDDTPYGGGIGMIMKVDVLHKAVEKAKDPALTNEEQKVVLLDPRGKTFQQEIAHEFSKLKHLILLCGHYEGFDERIRDYVDETISIGDYIVTGGEIPAMGIVDAVIRLLPGALTEDAAQTESFSSEEKLLDFPQYTKPLTYENKEVPDILLSGHHGNIQKWREEQRKKLTQKYRPDLLKEEAKSR